MALITGGLGSWYASFTGRDGRDRRLLLLVGMSAGLSAIFRSPIGAALLSVEILYADMEFEPNALLYTTIGAIVAYALNGMFVGFQPLFKVSSLVGQLPMPARLPLVCGARRRGGIARDGSAGGLLRRARFLPQASRARVASAGDRGAARGR